MCRLTLLPLRAVGLLCTASLALMAQQPDAGTAPIRGACAHSATAGSRAERTLAILSLSNERPVATSLRPFTPAAVAVILSDSSVAGYVAEQLASCSGRLRPASARLWYNTSDRNTDRDGAVWQGKGATISVTGGIDASFGALGVVLQPLAVFSENRPFSPSRLAPAPSDFRDPFWGQFIDVPFRFGNGAYTSLEPGESTVEVRYAQFGLGATTRSQHWGPAHFYPLVIGTEAAAYPRVFVEAIAVPLRFLEATANWHLGFLEASSYAGLPPGSRSRLAAALTGSIRPGAFPFLEVGGTRFFHVRRDPGSLSWRTAKLPFTGILKINSADSEVGGFNQLGSVFFRLAAPKAAAEIYGEFYREDHNVDSQDLAAEPDHASAYTVGLRKVYGGKAVSAFTLEYTNGRMSHLKRVRAQAPIYTHTEINEGHTHRGQPLGSIALLAGSGTTIAWSRLASHTSSDVTFEIRSVGQNQEGGLISDRQGGVYVLRVGRSEILRRHVVGGFVQLSAGYSEERGRHNLSVGLSVTR